MAHSNTRIQLSPNVFSRDFDGELVLVDLARGEYFGLNAVGGRAWEALAAGRTPSQIAAELAKEYDVGEATLTDDIVRLVDDLLRHGLAVELK